MVRTSISFQRIWNTLLLLLIFSTAYGQKVSTIDSLRLKVEAYAHDSISINPKEISLINSYLTTAKNLRSHPDIILAYQRLAAVHYASGEAQKALHYYKLYTLEVEQNAHKSAQNKQYFRRNLYENEIKALSGKLDKLVTENKNLLDTQTDFIENKYWLYLAIRVIIVISIGFAIGWLYLHYRRAPKSKAELEPGPSSTTLSDVVSQTQEDLVKAKTELDLADILVQQVIINPEHGFKENKSIRQKFLFYQPANLSGGCGLFIASSKRNTVLAVFEVPGSGAVGGLLSSHVFELINDLVNKHSIMSPLLIMNQLEVSLNEVFPAGAPFSGGIKIGVCLFDATEKLITYSGANMDLFIVQKGLCRTLDGVGAGLLSTSERIDFNLSEVTAGKGMNFYFATTGLWQQIGGVSNKPLGREAFVKTIESLSSQPVANHGKVINKILNDWKGGGEQNADILVLGFGFG